MSDNEPNILVELTDENELHCFRVVFSVKVSPETHVRQPLEVLLHTRQAFDLFHKLGCCLMDYFAKHSLELLKKIGERDEQRRLLEMASRALRSYQYGNAATELAVDGADAIDRFLATGEPQTLEGKGLR